MNQNDVPAMEAGVAAAGGGEEGAAAPNQQQGGPQNIAAMLQQIVAGQVITDLLNMQSQFFHLP